MELTGNTQQGSCIGRLPSTTTHGDVFGRCLLGEAAHREVPLTAEHCGSLHELTKCRSYTALTDLIFFPPTKKFLQGFPPLLYSRIKRGIFS